jgi:glycosyltransferase involved in cell wall biosynthesis
MRILMAHNYYQQGGGEDTVFATEADLLEAKGHQVWRYTLHNQEIEGANPLTVATKMLWNQKVYQELRSLFRREKIRIAHFHNTFPLVSPAAYYAAKAEGVAVVQTLHNYRLLCPNAMFFRDGQVCEDCLGQAIPLSGVIHGCYRNSRVASSGVAAMLMVHRLHQTWSRQVDVYIALTSFVREKLLQGGIPGDKIVVKPNFLYPDPGWGKGQGRYALFVGRLTREKGVATLLAAWEKIGKKLPLKIVGDGPLADQVAAAAQGQSGIEWLGRKDATEVYALMAEAQFLLFPSQWYEGLPRTIIESLAVGTPVIASDLGSMSSLIRPGQNGFHFQAGDAGDLVKTVDYVLSHPEATTDLRQTTRQTFEQNYTAEASYEQLMQIYDSCQKHSCQKQDRNGWKQVETHRRL